MIRIVVAAICLVSLLTHSLAAEEAERPKLGSTVERLEFKDIRYIRRSLKDVGDKKAIVLVFTNTTCPLVQKYLPKLKRLDSEYRDRGVQFVAVNVGADDSVQEMAQQAIDFGAEFPFVKDADGSCVKVLGAQRTPEVVLLDADRRLRYRGRIDDQHRIGGSRPDLTQDNLKQALEDILAGRDVTEPETSVDGCVITIPTFSPPKNPVTFYEHVLPLVQKHCQDCHHAGGNAPFALQTLDDVSSHADMIAEVVSDQRMPPWYAHPKFKFLNENRLNSSERKQIVAWAKTGKAAGDEAKAPPARQFIASKWEIGEPDLALTALETHSLPADGFVDYKYTVMPHVFTQDTWISAAEILPSNPAVVHHCNMAYWEVGKSFDAGNFVTGRVPGGTAMVLDEGLAFKIPKNSVVGLQIHYTTTGKPEKNRMSVGFKFPRSVIQKELHHVQVTTSRIAIPPGASAHSIVSSRVLPCDASGLGMFSHMHLRGKDMTFIAHTPDGGQETLLSIPNYSYAWQQNYRWDPNTKKFPKGTRVEVIAHYDNSRFNPFNPDATATVKNGPQTVNEMMFGFFFYTDDAEQLNLRVDPKTGRALADSAGGAE